MSESQLLWLVSFALLAAIVSAYLWRFRRRLAVDAERKKEAAELGIDKPVAQFPFIDPAHCIGCGACVRACPEGDVLGIVGGTAVVVNGLRCVGHGRCEEACPVGAISVGVGDLRSREDVPLLDESLQTSVPGIYVAGELGGLSLVRNAIAQGRRVVEQLAPSAHPELDLLIIGAGPSGLSAALAATSRGLRYLVLEKEETLGGSLLHYPRRKMVLTQPVSLGPWGELRGEEHQKENLLAFFEELIARAKMPILFGAHVDAIERTGDGLTVRTSAGIHRAANVLLALGRRGSPRRLGVPGEEKAKVLYRLIDAESYRDQRILVVGGGDSAVEAAIGLAGQKGNRVTLSYRREKLVRIKKKNEDRFAALIASGRVETLFQSQPLEIRDDAVLLATPAGELTLPNDYVFVFAGGVPPFDLLKKSGIAFGGTTARNGKIPSSVAT